MTTLRPVILQCRQGWGVDNLLNIGHIHHTVPVQILNRGRASEGFIDDQLYI
jgi:hypothetical protein